MQGQARIVNAGAKPQLFAAAIFATDVSCRPSIPPPSMLAFS